MIAHVLRSSPRRLIASLLGLTAGLAAGTAALAEVIGDPTGNNMFAVGTAPNDSPSAYLVAVSNGGSATGTCYYWIVCVGIAVSNGGTASGQYFAAAVQGCSTGFVSVSVGCAYGGALAIGTGGATQSDIAAVAVSGPAQSCGPPDLWILNLAHVGLWGATSVSATGPAWACGSSDAETPNVAVSGTNSASSCNDALVVSGTSTADGTDPGGVCATGPGALNLALSGLGTARSCGWGYPGASVSAAGSAYSCSGDDSISALGYASGGNAVGDGGASGNTVAVSGTNSATTSGGLAAVSGTGTASNSAVAVSGTGYASGSDLAVSPGGNAYACGGPVPLAVVVVGKGDTCTTPFPPPLP